MTNTHSAVKNRGTNLTRNNEQQQYFAKEKKFDFN